MNPFFSRIIVFGVIYLFAVAFNLDFKVFQYNELIKTMTDATFCSF